MYKKILFFGLVLVGCFAFSVNAKAESIQVTSPNGGEILILDKPTTITWNVQGFGSYPKTFSIMIGHGTALANPITITNSFQAYEGINSYTWTPGSTIFSEASDYYIWVGIPAVSSDRSDGSFTLKVLPDFIVETLAIMPSAPTVNQEILVSFNIKNIGSKGSYIPGYDRVYSGANFKEGSATCIANTFLSPNASCSGSFYVSYSIIGPNLISISLDPLQNIPESNENNNTTSLNFTVVNPISVISPNGGEKWIKEKSYLIKWSAPDLSKVNVILYKGSGCDASTVIGKQVCGTVYMNLATNIPNNGELLWKISSDLLDGSDYRVAVQNPNNLPFIDQSDNPFSIVQGVIVTSPNGGEKWEIGKTYSITWNRNDTFNSAGLTLLQNNQAVLGMGTVSNTGSYSWTIPTGYTGSGYSLKIVNMDDYSVFDVSDTTFSIVPAVVTPTIGVTVTSPNGGEKWEIGKTYAIKWEGDITDGAVYLYKKGLGTDIDKSVGAIFIAYLRNNTPNPVMWTIPTTIQPGEYFVGVSPAPAAWDSRVDHSDAPFSIVSAAVTPTLSAPTLSSPANNSTVLTLPESPWVFLQWNAVAGVSQYQISIQDAAGGEWLANTGEVKLRTDFIDGTYSWKVRSCKAVISSNTATYPSDSNCGSWSSTWTFTAKSEKVTPPTTPTQITSVSQLKSGEVVKTPSDPTVYVIKDGKKQPISSPQEFEQSGYKWDQIKIVQDDLLKQIAELKTQIAQLREELKKTGTLIKNPYGPEVYVIKDGKKEHVKSPEEFAQKGYNWEDIKQVTAEEIAQIPDFAEEAAAEGTYASGTLIKSADSPDVYIIIKGKKKKIPDPATFNNWGYKWDQIKEAPASTVAEFPEVKIALNLVRAQGDTKIYRIIGDKRLWIPTFQAFLGSGYTPNSEIVISPEELKLFEYVKYIRQKGSTKILEIKPDVNNIIKKYPVTDTSNIPAEEIKTVTPAEFLAYPIGK